MKALTPAQQTLVRESLRDLRRYNRRLYRALVSLLNAVEDCLETKESAVSWQKSGDMQKYINDAVDALGADDGESDQ